MKHNLFMRQSWCSFFFDCGERKRQTGPYTYSLPFQPDMFTADAEPQPTADAQLPGAAEMPQARVYLNDPDGQQRGERCGHASVHIGRWSTNK